ncbi:metallophosphoesterase [Cyclobacteriaceae bacterium]|nr:metallophosphoesterase [Cyclobacteriaceae bacterium]
MKGYIILFILLFIEVAAYYFGVKNFQGKNQLYFKIFYFIGFFALAGNILLYLTYYKTGGQSNVWTTTLFGISSAFFVFNLFFAVFGIIAEIYPLAVNIFSSKKSFSPERRDFIGKVIGGVALLPFASMIYGVVKGRFDFKVHKVTLTFKDLPKEFDGFKIAQISDVHSGSFDSDFVVKKGLGILQKQDPDMILFTGDLVNNYEHEIVPYIHHFKNLNAPFGKFSVLGNHDYGWHGRWDSKQDMSDNLVKLKSHHQAMGFDLLNNENRSITKKGASINLLGVENWGKPPFPQFGDLDKSLDNVKHDDFSILMSHDPDHWEEKTLRHQQHIHLTLAGHTHGMQFGVEIPGWKWSPVKYKYPRWAGLYEEQNQYLYVNRGFGYIGYPGRFGIWPEITMIELKKG